MPFIVKYLLTFYEHNGKSNTIAQIKMKLTENKGDLLDILLTTDLDNFIWIVKGKVLKIFH